MTRNTLILHATELEQKSLKRTSPGKSEKGERWIQNG